MLCRDQRRDRPRKIWENGFLRFLVTRCEAKKANRDAKRDRLARTASKCWGACLRRARSRSACGCGELARQSESTYAQLVDIMSRIVAYNRWRDSSLENATCALGKDQANLNVLRIESWYFSRFSSVSKTELRTRSDFVDVAFRRSLTFDHQTLHRGIH